MARIDAAAINFPIFAELYYDLTVMDTRQEIKLVRLVKLPARSLYLTETSPVSKVWKLVEKAGRARCDLADIFTIVDALKGQKQSRKLHLLMLCGNVCTIDLKVDGTWSHKWDLRGPKGLPWEPEDEIVCRL